MPIQFPDFGRISFEEANPMLKGFGVSQDILTNILKQRLAQLQNKKLTAELPFAGELAKSTAAYKEAMAKYLSNPYQMQRFMTPLGKTLNEQRMYGGGGAPGMTNENAGNMPVSNESGYGEGEGTDPYGLQIEKMTTDPKARERNLYATNVEKTIGTIDPEALTHYSGIPGMVKKGIETGKAALGEYSPFGPPSETYLKHLESLRASEQLAAQVRQFYGESIQPVVREELKHLTNPSFWASSPEVARRLYDKYIQLIQMESGTYQGALKKPQQQNILKKHTTEPTAQTAETGGEYSSKRRKWNQKTQRLE